MTYVSHDYLWRAEEASPVLWLPPSSQEEHRMALLALMDDTPARTRFSAGDMAEIIPEDSISAHAIRSELKHNGVCPRVWQVRFVISRWAYDCLMSYGSIIEDAGEFLQDYQSHTEFLDHVASCVQEQNYDTAEFPMIYAHGMPHGLYPNSAQWFREGGLKRSVIKAPTEEWTTILDAAGAPYQGFPSEYLDKGSPILDCAPSRYQSGDSEHGIFTFEEGAVHTAALLGFEEKMMVPGTNLEDFYLR